MSTQVYTTHLVPHQRSPIPPSTIAAYRAITLHALRESPSSFQASYDHDASLSLEQWAARLQHPLANVLVCTAHARSIPPSERTLENGEWVGKMLLVGPLTPEDFFCALGDTAKEARGCRDALCFFWRGFYMRPEVRGSEAVVVMLQGMLDFLRDGAVEGGLDWARVRGQIIPGHESDLAPFYRVMGGEEIGWLEEEAWLRMVEVGEVEGERKERHRMAGEGKKKLLMEAWVEC